MLIHFLVNELGRGGSRDRKRGWIAFFFLFFLLPETASALDDREGRRQKNVAFVRWVFSVSLSMLGSVFRYWSAN